MGESRVVIPIFGILDVTGEVIGMWVVLAAVAVISLLFCALQAIVFTTLVSIYLQEATE